MDTIEFVLNKKKVRVKVRNDRMLLWVLRTNFGLTGTKYGCGEGYCGSCTVLVNGKAVQSCQVPVSEVKGKKVTTIEGLSTNGKLHPVQKAFGDHDALQCGFCTPGMVLRACSLLKEYPRPSRQRIIKEMEGNLCRCGNYERIIKAIQTVSRSGQEI